MKTTSSSETMNNEMKQFKESGRTSEDVIQSVRNISPDILILMGLCMDSIVTVLTRQMREDHECAYKGIAMIAGHLARLQTLIESIGSETPEQPH